MLPDILNPFRIRWNTTIRRSTRGQLSKQEKKNLNIRKFADANHQVFFGYYDVTPFSQDENFLLAIHAPLENLPPKPETEISVGFYDLNREEPLQRLQNLNH